MANKAADQVTIVDVTDAYSVILTSEAYTFPGTTSAAKAGSTTTQVVAMVGAAQVDASVTLSEITAPSGVTVTKDTDTTSPTLTIAVSTSVTAGGNIVIPVHVGDVVIEKTFSYAIAFTGATGTTGSAGTSATTVLQGLDSYTIPATTAGNASAATTITVPFSGWIGTTRAAATLVVGTLPSGVTVTSNTAATSSADGSLVLAVASGATLGGAASGSIPLTYTVNGLSFSRALSWAKAITGTTGTTGGTGTSAISAITGNNAITIPSTKDGATTSATTITIPFAAYQGTSRIAATIAATNLPSGITAGTNTAATTSADGSLILNVASGSTLGGAASGDITLTITAGGKTFVNLFSWAKALTGATGSTGAAGADAITLVVTSSNGFIFKNSAISTVLTAHVYQSGVELTGAALTAAGTIKWYKDGGASSVATGSTLTIDAGQVTNKATYTATLEG